MTDKKLSPADAKRLTDQLAAHQAAVDAEAAAANAARLRDEAGRLKPLTDFIGSKQFAAFVTAAKEARDATVGHTLVTHLAGALVSLDVAERQITEFAEAVAALDAKPEA